MMRNRLKELLVQRNLKISRVANDLPNLSRNTINSVANNKTKMVQIETVNSLCQYLGIKPEDFFEYLPFDIEINTSIDTESKLFYEGVDEVNGVLRFTNLSFTTYLKKTSKNTSIGSETFDLSISPLKKYTFIPLLSSTDEDNDYTIKGTRHYDFSEAGKKLFEYSFYVMLGHLDESETYKNQEKNFSNLLNKDLSASFLADVKLEIFDSVFNSIFEEVKKFHAEADISNMYSDCKFTFSNASEAKIHDNEKDNKLKMYNYISDDELPF